MPIYAYRCADCGHAQDVLQKMSDAVLTVCPSCGASAFQKQLTAAGFQLKGSGWYVTDFRDGNKGKPGEAKAEDKGDAKPDAAAETKSDDKPAAAPAKDATSGDAGAGKPAASPASPTSPAATSAPAPAAAPASAAAKSSPPAAPRSAA